MLASSCEALIIRSIFGNDIPNMAPISRSDLPSARKPSTCSLRSPVFGLRLSLRRWSAATPCPANWYCKKLAGLFTSHTQTLVLRFGFVTKWLYTFTYADGIGNLHCQYGFAHITISK
jgi:hypothetical protein